ncbi:allophanate hydrolase subunit 2-domain-containing protein [Cristinia sonorae]|uniref:Allophanate hydrolase subunit 2-domain-containing protein n=1 Tax=Cristinia sonorae TaxID=1940300 RepID=A0A8K0UJU6_9AGAR|nr:allophanate hydrolase subunit 2-domain-containing protein [Cristinia sonorae]
MFYSCWVRRIRHMPCLVSPVSDDVGFGCHLSKLPPPTMASAEYIANRFQVHKLLVANRGEIAIRILRTAKALGVPTVAIYTPVDATAPHVLLADESIALLPYLGSQEKTGDEVDLAVSSKGYLDIDAIVKVCEDHGITLVHPGYGFLSENASFARALAEKGVCLLGPDWKTVEEMGLKHRARALAIEAQVPVVPGSDGLVTTVEEGIQVAAQVGYPLMLKATAGGGGMGLVVCRDEEELKAKLPATQKRALSLFHNGDIFIEKFFDASRHIEVQIFGNGTGHVIHMGERECSVQRRHQKIIEEAPSPYLFGRQDLRDRICESAVRLGSLIKYKSAGTVEFLVDDASGQFFFLEMNTRLQVEHGITEALHPGLDIVELMILQGICEHPLTGSREDLPGLPVEIAPCLAVEKLDQTKYAYPQPGRHAIETRIYCENPANDFAPTPGLLQHVHFPTIEGVRFDTWVSTGMRITPFYDPLIAKVIVCGHSRADAIAKFEQLLQPEELATDHTPTDRLSVLGPPTNIPFLHRILNEPVFLVGKATTEWVDKGGVKFTPSAFTVVSPGINTTVQSLPTRNTGLGIPPSGPLDPLSFQAGNIIIGNQPECEGLELVVPPRSTGRAGGLSFSATFHVKAVISLTGAPATLTVDGEEHNTWTRVEVPAGAKVVISGPKEGKETGGGLRGYLLIAGGLPGIPEFLGSKSTSLGIGGYQGRALQNGDVLQLTPLKSVNALPQVPRSLIPKYPSEWTLLSLPGPHDDTEFLTTSGIESFYARKWKVASASNRMGIRLEPVIAGDDQDASGSILEWARKDGGEGGSHPSNILDNGYARGSVNLNGDTPVILTNEGPSMGGYVCVATLATADQWKLGQLRPGDVIQFQRISIDDALDLRDWTERWLDTILALASGFNASPINLLAFSPKGQFVKDPKLHVIPATSTRPKVVFRQAGDSGILVEYGEMTLDLLVRARIQAFENAVRDMGVPGIVELAPCIRSTMVHYNNELTTQAKLLGQLIEAEESLPEAYEEMSFPGRKLTFPIVLDDKWNREALKQYMRSIRDKAVYLPSNIEYLANNNGVEGGAKEALRLLVASPWIVLGVGFYLACPFLVPLDHRCRLVGQKMNPSRTFTPSGAVGIAGVVAAIYPVESPGGYQLFGRTLPTWQAWGNGPDFQPDRPWLLQPFDHVVFEPVSEEEYLRFLTEFESGRYKFKIENTVFEMKSFISSVSAMKDEINEFKARQREAVKREEAKENALLEEWQQSKKNASSAAPADDVGRETQFFSSASLSGTVWQIKVKQGDKIETADQVVVILEAMKTEIPVTAGEENVGLKVAGLGKGITEGKTVQAGDKLVFFAEE